MSKFLIAGLGNIGAEYANTRHNVGFDMADAFVKKQESFFVIERLAQAAEIKLKGKPVIIIKPTTYMNLSGRAIKYWLEKEKIPVEQLLVLVDDLALPLSRVRLRPSGSDAGHNGLKSVQEALGTDQYPKLRFGIGNAYQKGEQSDFVLGKWSMEELPLVQLKIVKCVEIIESFITMGINRTMNTVNKFEFTL